MVLTKEHASNVNHTNELVKIKDHVLMLHALLDKSSPIMELVKPVLIHKIHPLIREDVVKLIANTSRLKMRKVSVSIVVLTTLLILLEHNAFISI